MKQIYNKTQLNPGQTFERHVYHRDQFAHYLRWTHVLKHARIGQNILDWGCGTGNLAEVFYRNRYKPAEYLGLDVRESTVSKNNTTFEKVDWASFSVADLCKRLSSPVWSPKNNNSWDFICSFEVIEHIGKQNVDAFLDNIELHMSEDTTLLISTPCYDESVGAADNHIIDGEVGELTYNEMKDFLSNRFKIDKIYGTFASQRDYKPYMNEWQKQMYDSLKDYYDSNILSNLMAPLFPEYSRNCIWRCTI